MSNSETDAPQTDAPLTGIARRRLLTGGAALLGTTAALAVIAGPASAETTAVGVYDVTDPPYGALGDGTDDSAQIQAAIDAGAKTGAPFVVYLPLPPVAYGLGSSLKLPAFCSLVGEAGSHSLLRCLPALTGPAIVNGVPAAGAAGIALRALEIDGNAAIRSLVTTPLVALAGVPGAPATRLSVTDCRLRDAPAGGVSFDCCSLVVCSFNEFASNGGTSIAVRRRAVDIRIEGNHLRDGTGSNITLDGTAGGAVDVLVAQNVVLGGAGAGISVLGASKALVAGNIVERAGSGVTVKNGGDTATSDVVVADNVVISAGAPTGSVGTGIVVEAGLAGSGSATRVRVEGNTVTNPKADGIRVRSHASSSPVSDAVVSDNIVTCAKATNGVTGIVVDGAAVADPAVVGNVVVGASEAGIRIGDGTGAVARPTISGNRIRNCGGTALRVVGADRPMIVGNRSATTSGPAPEHGVSLERITGALNDYGNDFTGSVVADMKQLDVSAPRGRVSLGERAILQGAGSPEGVFAAAPGTLFLSSMGGASTTLFVKESGTDATGWTAK